MNKNEILKAAQTAHDDEGKRHTILQGQGLIFGLYSLGLVFLIAVRMVRNQPMNDLFLLILLGGFGIELSSAIKRRTLTAWFFVVI